MNFSTWIEENKDKIKWEPIETLPWELSTEFDPPRKYMPQGIILRYKQRENGLDNYELIGDNIAGERTEGCSCCSAEWVVAIDSRYRGYNAWAWAFGDPKKLKMQGAIEALNSLLAHCRDHTISIDESVVYNFLKNTKKELSKV